MSLKRPNPGGESCKAGFFFTAYTAKSSLMAKGHMFWKTKNLLETSLRQIFGFSEPTPE
jgi:hypothetical protein